MLNVYSIFDVKSDSFSPPFVAPTNGIALRMFSDLATDGQSQVSKHPEDFKLILLGTFDEHSGRLQDTEAVSLGFAVEYTRKE